jgi:Do/DeqQ family serine protease
MQLGRSLAFLLQIITAGLALAFVAVVLKPDLLTGARQVVELRRTSEAPPAAAAAAPGSYADAVTRSAPAVVNIHTAKLVTERPNPLFEDPIFRRFFGEAPGGTPRQRVETSLGSGVIVSPQGHVLTNNHVIESADQIRVQLADGRSADATLVGSDPETDLAVLKIDQAELPAMVLGSSDALRVGDIVLAIGNPFGVGQTVTMGIVSATGRSQLGISTFENFIQTDAAINPGNSGGALVNSEGALVGINTAIFSRSGGSQGIGFAIPVTLANDVLEQILEHGRVVRGWLGVEIQEVTPELAESFGLPSAAGVVVAGVLGGGPADRAGIEPGDIITEIDGEPVGDADDALARIVRLPPDRAVELNGWRQQAPASWKVEIAERPQGAPR